MSERRYFNESTADLAKRVDDAKSWLLTLHDIYAELLYRETKSAKKLRHELEKFLVTSQEYFPWPNTNIAHGTGRLPNDAFQYASGMLRGVGYKVGASGVSATQRYSLLANVYSEPLRRINSVEYMSEWGKPKSATRLKKIAYSIATFVKIAKHNDSQKYAVAITEWEADLAYLKRTYYAGRHSFKWPSVSIRGHR